MSRVKFLKETEDCFYWREKNNLPVHKDIFDIDKHIRDKWVSENRHSELLSYILDEWDNGDFNDYTDFIEEYELDLIKNRRSKDFIGLWKGILGIRLQDLWQYIKDCKLNSNEFISRNSESRLREIKRRQKFVLNGIDRFSIGLNKLDEAGELAKLKLIEESVIKLEPPKPSQPTDKRKIDEKLFWELIDESRNYSADKTQLIAELKNKLEKFKSSEIRNFDKLFRIKTNELNTQRNWALAYVFRQGCGDDEFDYFKAWVVSMGSNAFRVIKQFETEKIYDILFSEDPQFEDFIYLAQQVYEEKISGLMKANKIKQQKITGKEWDENNIEGIYPEIFELYNKKNNR